MTSGTSFCKAKDTVNRTRKQPTNCNKTLPILHPIDDSEHPLLYLPGTGTASHETAISGSFQQSLAGICNSVWAWWLIMGWIPRWGSLWIVHPFVLAPNFVFVTPSMGVLFPILRGGIVSTLQSSFFLSFMC